MVKLRLTRKGATHSPFYRIVATDSRKSRDGQCLEVIGHYDPTKQPKVIVIKEERAKYWLSVGAQPTETVRALLMKNTSITFGPRKKSPLKKKAVVAEKAEA